MHGHGGPPPGPPEALMSLLEYLQADPACRNLAEGAIHAVAPALSDPDPTPGTPASAGRCVWKVLPTGRAMYSERMIGRS